MGWIERLFGDDRVVRDPEFAGVHYPSEELALRGAVDEHLPSCGNAREERRLRGLVAPYGDYEYAGPTMGVAYGLLEQSSATPDRILLVAPSARVPFRGLAVAGFDAFATPMGELEVDVEAVQRAADADLVRPIVPAFEPAAALELQLPFLRAVLPEAQIVPVLVGDAEVSEVVACIDPCWDERTLLVVAANLSEGYARREAEELDEATVSALEEGREGEIDRRHTSARLALQALVRTCGDRDLGIEAVERSTSASSAGHAEKVVGYAAVSIHDRGDA